jgi:drug/metabolite transporter (DMT)-like permease
VRLFHLDWERRKLIAVIIATLGVVAVVYGGSQINEEGGDGTSATYRAPLTGDLLTLIASIGYGLYQVLYKRYAALPSDPELHITDEFYDRVSISSDESPLASPEPDLSQEDVVYPPPFGFHPNFLTSLIGLVTFVVLMLFLPLLDYIEFEPFRAPPNWWTVFSISGIAASGVIFNSGLMVS